MRKFVVFTDGNTDIPQSHREQVIVLPQYYYFEEDTVYGDEQVLDRDTFFKTLENKRAYTAGCNPDLVRRKFTKVLEEGCDVLCITFSSAMSGSYNTICAVAAELREEYPQAVIEVIDSISATLGTGFLCMDALELAESGMDCQETADALRKRVDKIEIYFIVENFRHLVAGGRVSPVIGKIGDVLNIKPILTIQEGKIVLFKKARGLAMAFKNIKEIADSGRVKRKGSIFVHNKELYTMCNDSIPTNYHIDLNLIISSHVGPDTTGIAIERE